MVPRNKVGQEGGGWGDVVEYQYTRKETTNITKNILIKIHVKYQNVIKT